MICVTRPTRLLDELVDVLGFAPTAEAGVYHCNQALPQWIIYPTALAVLPKHYPLLARGAKLTQFIDHCLQAGLTDYLPLVVDMGLATDPEVIWRKLPVRLRHHAWCAEHKHCCGTTDENGNQ